MTNLNNSIKNQSNQVLIMDESGNFKVINFSELTKYKQQNPNFIEVNSNLPMDTGMEELMLQPPPPVIRKNTSSFYFHPEDEEEVSKITVDQTSLTIKKKYSIDKILIKVMENYKLSLDDTDRLRLRSALFSFLRDRRSFVDTQELLIQPAKQNGFNLDQNLTGNLMSFLKEIKEKIHKQSGMVIDELKEAINTDINIKEILPSKKLDSDKVSQPKLPEEAIIKFSEPTPAVNNELRSGQVKSLPRVSDIRVSDIRKTTTSTADELPKIQRLKQQDKHKLNDVKKDYKLVGPIDELAILNLETFRRLGHDTDERLKKIASKVNLLAQDSVSKKVAGIKAWRTSPLYKMYVAVGQASLENDLNVKQVIRDFTNKGKEILTLEEFESISDLNKMLRF